MTTAVIVAALGSILAVIVVGIGRVDTVVVIGIVNAGVLPIIVPTGGCIHGRNADLDHGHGAIGVDDDVHLGQAAHGERAAQFGRIGDGEDLPANGPLV